MRKFLRYVPYILVGLVGLAIGLGTAIFVAFQMVKSEKNDALVDPPDTDVASAVVSMEVQQNTALHESGHAVVAAFLLGPSFIKSVSVRDRPDEDGEGGATEVALTVGPMTADTIERFTAVCLAGRAADKMLRGVADSGSANDILVANQMVWRKNFRFGLGNSLVVRERSETTPEMFAMMEEELAAANECAELIVAVNAASVAALAQELMVQPVTNGIRSLSGEILERMLSEHPLTAPAIGLNADLGSFCTPSVESPHP